jgi:hypothetical protein
MTSYYAIKQERERLKLGECPSGELARAAHCYERGSSAGWPWRQERWQPGDRKTNLVRAGALYLAEYDRLRALPEGAVRTCYGHEDVATDQRRAMRLAEHSVQRVALELDRMELEETRGTVVVRQAVVHGVLRTFSAATVAEVEDMVRTARAADKPAHQQRGEEFERD